MLLFLFQSNEFDFFFSCYDITHDFLYLLLKAAIIISEVNGVWPDVRKQIDDPFLVSFSFHYLNHIKIYDN